MSPFGILAALDRMLHRRRRNGDNGTVDVQGHRRFLVKKSHYNRESIKEMKIGVAPTSVVKTSENPDGEKVQDNSAASKATDIGDHQAQLLLDMSPSLMDSKSLPCPPLKVQAHPAKFLSEKIPSRHPSEITQELSQSAARSPDLQWQDNFKLIRQFHKSAEGFVSLVEERQSGQQFVIKTIPCPTSSDPAACRIPAEASMLVGHLQPHPNVVRLVNLHFDQHHQCSLVLEYCAGGDLFNFTRYFSDRNDKIPAPFLWHFISSMIDVLGYLHNGDIALDTEIGEIGFLEDHQPVLHRDIKPANLLLRWSSQPNFGMPDIVLADFGLSCLERNNTGFAGTRGYMAPELEDDVEEFAVESKSGESAHELGRCTQESDMYAFGAMLLEMLSAHDMRHSEHAWEAWKASSVGDMPLILNIVQACLERNPKDRPKIEELYKASASLKTRLKRWYDAGGRLPQYTWPDPLLYEGQEEEEAKENLEAWIPDLSASAYSHNPILGNDDMSPGLDRFPPCDSAARTEDMSNISGFSDNFCWCSNHRTVSLRKPNPDCKADKRPANTSTKKHKV